MVSLLHEALVELFRSGRTLASDLLRSSAAIEVPADVVVENLESAFNQITPTEYRADLAQRVSTADGRTLFAVVVEPQLAPDDDKRRSWPVYVTTLHARLDCPVALLVVAPDPAVARWAAKPIGIWPGFELEPIVVGPSAVPWIDERRARERPELAVLSAIAHGNEQGGLEVVLAAIEAITTLDDEHVKLYYDLMVARLSDAHRAELETMILGGKKYEYQSEIARRLVAQGREEGRAEGREEELRRNLLELLEARGLLTEEAQVRVLAEEDLSRLRTWLRRAATAEAIDAVLST